MNKNAKSIKKIFTQLNLRKLPKMGFRLSFEFYKKKNLVEAFLHYILIVLHLRRNIIFNIANSQKKKKKKRGGRNQVRKVSYI